MNKWVYTFNALWMYDSAVSRSKESILVVHFLKITHSSQAVHLGQHDIFTQDQIPSYLLFDKGSMHQNLFYLNINKEKMCSSIKLISQSD